MHTFINISELRKIPPASLTMVRRSPTLNHPRRGQLVLVGASAFAEALVDVLARVTRASKVRFFKTDDEGMAYLRRVIADETVQTLPPKMADVSTSPSGGSSIAS